jgi:hypothetical protein
MVTNCIEKDFATKTTVIDRKKMKEAIIFNHFCCISFLEVTFSSCSVSSKIFQQI